MFLILDILLEACDISQCCRIVKATRCFLSLHTPTATSSISDSSLPHSFYSVLPSDKKKEIKKEDR